jgi:hypothetical protein
VKIWKPLALGILSIGVATATVVPMLRSSRSVRPIGKAEESTAPVFDHEHSAGLFVGVRTFDGGSIAEVPYAVDDAVDLAYMFAIDHHVRLVAPQRVVLALSGRPVKTESQHHLLELERAGAKVRSADQREIVSLLEQQAALAGRSGLLILSIATHGVVRQGIPHVLSASAVPLSMAALLDVIADHEVPRSLIFVDACRVRIGRDGRGVNANALAIAPLFRRMPRIHGQVMLSAVGSAYDDPRHCNGVFTKAVIDGLGCKATSPRDQVTAETLAAYVERTVRGWIRANKNPRVGSAIQINIDGEARNMPLAQCRPQALAGTFSTNGSVLSAFDQKRPLWQRDVRSPITHSDVVDTSVVVSTHSALIAFDGNGNRLWSDSPGSPLRVFMKGDLFRKHINQIVALWGSSVALYSADGEHLGNYEHTQPLRCVAIGRPTNHHAPRIVVTSANDLVLLDPKKVSTGKPLWSGSLVPRSETIEGVKILDFDHDSKEEIAVATVSGKTLILDFKGRVIGRPTHGSPIGFALDRRARRNREHGR